MDRSPVLTVVRRAVQPEELRAERLSAADQALFAAGTETYHWDYGGNHTGYLRYWTTRAPGSTTNAVLSDLGNNIQGQRTLTNQTINLAGYTDLTRQFLRLYYISGAPRRSYYRDHVGDADVMYESTSIIQLDARALPASVLVTSMLGDGAPPQTIAVQSWFTQGTRSASVQMGIM